MVRLKTSHCCLARPPVCCLSAPHSLFLQRGIRRTHLSQVVKCVSHLSGISYYKKALCQRGSRCSVVGHSADGDTFSLFWLVFFFTSSYLVTSAEEVLFSPGFF